MEVHNGWSTTNVDHIQSRAVTDQPPLMFQLVNHAITCEWTERTVLNSSIRRSKSRLFNVVASSHRERHEPTQYLPENDHK